MDFNNAVLIQGISLKDLEAMIGRVVDARMAGFYERVKERPPSLVRRKDAAKMIGVSCPTIDKYAQHGFLRSHHVGGRVYFEEEQLQSLRSGVASFRQEHTTVSKEQPFAGDTVVLCKP